MTRRILTLTGLGTLGIGLMAASSFGVFGARASAQERPLAPIITTPESAETLTTDFGTARLLATIAQTNGTFSVIEAVQRPGYWTNEHQHAFDESFYVMEGTLTVEIGGETRQVPAGSYVFIPGNVRHAQGNRGTAPVRNIVSTRPAGLEPMFRRRAEEFREANPVKP